VTLGPRAQELVDLVDRKDVMTAADEMDLPAMQIAAADERFQDHRKRIAILQQRASDMGVDKISSLDDIVPLLFAHTTYKSYPTSFLTNGQWDRLLRWFETVSAEPMDDVDLSEVEDVDSWIAAVTQAGHYVYASSGTSGKNSFGNQSQDDIDTVADLLTRMWGWPSPVPRDNSRPLFIVAPASGPSRFNYAGLALAKYVGRPGAVYTLTDEALMMGEVNKTMRIQQAMAAGRATPSEVEEFERSLKGKADTMRHGHERLARALQQHEDEPFVLWGGLPQTFALIECCRELRFEGGNFNPEAIYLAGGGTKGLALPEGFQSQIETFFSSARRYNGYGMSETVTHSPRCEDGRYHVPPWLILMVVDELGETRRYLPSGPVTGRAAYMDPVWDGHWGGTITGDWITADYGRCVCGRPGPTVDDSVQRAKDVIGLEDDKVSCAGAVDAYVRGALVTGPDGQ
jgi:hypothetical protein